MNTRSLLGIFWLLAAGCAQSVGTYADLEAGVTATGGAPAWSSGGAMGSDAATPSASGAGAMNPPEPASCALPTSDSECRTAPFCGCPTGENCIVADATTGRTACVQPGNVAEGGLCTGLGSCVTGTTCIDDICKPYCSSDADCAQKCVGTVSQGNLVPGLSTCTSACALDDPASCGPGVGCFLLTGGLSDCRPAGSSTTTCVGVQDCAPGYVCLDDGTCAKWCHVGGAPCSLGSCQTGDGSTIVDGIVYGICF